MTKFDPIVLADNVHQTKDRVSVCCARTVLLLPLSSLPMYLIRLLGHISELNGYDGTVISTQSAHGNEGLLLVTSILVTGTVVYVQGNQFLKIQ